MPPLILKRAALYLALQSLLFAPTLAVSVVTNLDGTEVDMDTQTPTTTLSVITITANQESAYGPVKGLAPSRVSTTTGFEESILKSTQAVNVVGQQQIQSTGSTSVVEALGYTPGVFKSVAADLTTEDFIIRGFRNSSSYRDGQKYQANIFNGRQEVYGLERIEVLKGPGSVLSGTLPPGGMVNAISKKPHFEKQYEINGEVGSFSRKEVSADINQPLSDNLAVRVVGVYRDSDTFIDYVPDDRQYIAPSLTWWPTQDTRLTLQADYQKDKTKYVPGLPVSGTLYHNENGRIDKTVYPGVVGFDRYDSERATYGYEVEHSVTPDLTVKQYLRKMETKLEFPYSNVAAPNNTNETDARRNVLDRLDSSDQITGGLTAVYNWSLDGDTNGVGDKTSNLQEFIIDNVTLFGIDYAKQSHESERFNGTANAVNLYDRNYQFDEVGTAFSPNVFASGKTQAKQKGAYLQNQTTINNKWVGVLGVRHDKADLEQVATFINNVQEGDYSETTSKVGLVYLMENGIAPYASYNESFEVALGVDESGNDFDPTTGRQYEAGVRYQPIGSDMLLTVSFFDIKQKNVVEPGATPGTREQLGEVRSKGAELEAQIAVNENANIIVAYGYNDARITKASPQTPERKGLRQANVPYNTAAIWGDYRLADFGLMNLKVGAGVRYSGSSINRKGNVEIPSFTLVDFMTSYKVDNNWTLSLHAKNLFDKQYATCTVDCFYGEPRNILAKATYQW